MTLPSENPDKFDVIVYGLVSVTAVSLLSLGGAVIGPLLKSDSTHRWLHFFLALAVSTLSSDAILHIIPQVLGVHNHAHGHSHGHDHDDDHHHHNTSVNSTTQMPVHHDHHGEEITHYCSSPVTAHSPSDKEVATCSSSISSGIGRDSDETDGEETKNERRQMGGHELINIHEEQENDAEICGLKPRALIILFGDGLHNLVDGIAIGASFMTSLKLGFITTIAVVCHELPHEIGDLAVLIDSGLSMTRALILNLLSALTSYVGLFVAIALGENKVMETVLLAVTAGMFLYVAWVDMLSHLKNASLVSDHWAITGLFQILGFTIGFLLIFSLGWFEHLFAH
uniref:Uncharacterized protein n=1 Tax=Caenorhabditis japonica TaxID=281687 RepID=A0A8R1HJC6_CAEJA